MRKSFYVGCINVSLIRKESNRIIHRHMPISVFIKVVKKIGLEIYSIEQSENIPFFPISGIAKCYKITFKYKLFSRKNFINKINILMSSNTIENYFKIEKCS